MHVPHLAPAVDAIRLTLHVLAATIWVGGQFTVAGLLPTARSFGDGAPKRIAQAFGRIQWPAYGVLLLTGIWNVAALHTHNASHAWQAVLGVKIAVVLLAGVAAFLHQRSSSKAGLAAWGAISGIASVAALALGVLLAG
jgi:putative copper export protein